MMKLSSVNLEINFFCIDIEAHSPNIYYVFLFRSGFAYRSGEYFSSYGSKL